MNLFINIIAGLTLICVSIGFLYVCRGLYLVIFKNTYKLNCKTRHLEYTQEILIDEIKRLVKENSVLRSKTIQHVESDIFCVSKEYLSKLPNAR